MFMRTLAAVSALCLTTGLAQAQDDNSVSFSGRVSADDMENLARSSNIIGGNVYGLDETYDMNVWSDTDVYSTIDTTWEQIGTVDDLALSTDGQLVGLVVESGGILGIGDDTVLLELSDLRLIDDGSGDYAWVTHMTEDQLEDMPEVEENWF